MKRKGISLIVLVISIIVIAILATAIILLLFNNNTLDQAKKARFMSDYRTVQDGVNVFSLSRFNAETNEFELPLKGYLTDEDKTYLTENVPTLKTKIEELSGTLNTANLAWISSEDIGVKLSKEKAEKGYILDVANGLIYDYNGDYFEEKMWHTLDGGVVSNGPGVPGDTTTDEELWDGWIKLTLYYPSNSTARQWRLGTEGELRADPMLMWQNYTGPITIPLDRVKDVWIKYELDNKEVVIPPAGTLLVDIVPDKTGYTKVPGVKVHINFDETATVKEYRVGDSNWMPYTGEFNVTENCIIEARARKTETIYNTDGTVLTTRNIAGRDLVYIGNIGIEETELEAPTIKRLDPIGTEKARVQVTYPENANKRIYKVNYGIEENYTTEISVQNYGTYIIAYYYDASGKRSQAAGIRINDTSSTGTTPEPPEPYDPKPPRQPGDPPPTTPLSTIPAPIVVVNPTTVVEEVQVSINAAANADKVYIRLGRYADYQLYTAPITVRENMDIYAYYRTYMGEKSDTGYGRVSNIKKNSRPYVRIDADPYPYTWNYGASEVQITISYSDATTIEYSEDGIIYKPYTSSFKVTENKTIYARGTNSYGVTETSLNITNIGKIKAPVPIENLNIGINVNPEPTVSTIRYAKANVSIDYDTKATEKYYRIGTYGDLKPYTGAFEVTSNCTIYAYAKGTNSKGSTSKRIDNLSSGIAEPIITAVPGNREQSSKVSVTIEYDKYSKIKRYSIDGSPLRDYGGAFEVTKNGSVIYAYSENDVGQKSEARYTVTNIIPTPPVLALDKGQYYILKLNYPEGSKNREYKWKANGEWKGYKEAGILLLKPQYKDQLIQNGTLIKIQDENGNLVTFAGDYYFIDVSISELFENIFMRWDRIPLGAPQIVVTPSEPAMQVTVNIVYNPNLITKLYKVVNPDGSVKTDWTNYTSAISIDKNNSIVYAKGMDDSEVWTSESTKKITNIDENPPVLKLTADLETAMQRVGIRVSVTDDVAVGKVKWAKDILGESYFASSGTEIVNNSLVYITSNGYYTFYAEDKVGNKQVYTLNVTNIDLTAPDISIFVNPEDIVGLSTTITIDYGDSVLKQYKVGASNATWSTYSAPFNLTSNTVLANNWQNADGTVTIYAKGKDKAGNEITVQKKVLSLDLDKAKTPIINSNSSYATLTEYGSTFDAETTITYDTRTDIDNYYSIDNGVTWIRYTGKFDMLNGTVIAKSVKKVSGLETVVSKTVTMPADALKPQAYDGNDATYISTSNQHIVVDSSMVGKSIRVRWATSSYDTVYLNFLNDAKQVISTVTRYNGTYDDIYTIPANTKWIRYDQSYSGCRLYEIQPSNEPTFKATNGYMTLTADPTKATYEPYQMLTISYFQTSSQRLYRIGTTGSWLNYNDQPVKVNQNQTLYAKGIDANGNETRIISSYTANIPDALKREAYDGNDATYISVTNQYMAVDSSMIGKSLRVRWGTSSYDYVYLNFLNDAKQVISTVTRYNGTYDDIYTIPANTKWIRYDQSYSGCRLYEIQPSNEPTFTAVNGYMTLTADPTKAIYEPYQMVTVSYFPTSVQRLYRIGTTGNWLNYEDKAIWVKQGETLYSKGIDIYGNETRLISSYTANVPDALKKEAYDGNDATYISVTNQYMIVDLSMIGKSIRVRWGTSSYDYVYLRFLDENKNIISTISRYNSTAEDIYKIPTNTKWIRYDQSYSGCRLSEIQPSNEPTFSATNGYMTLTADPTKAIYEPYQMVTVSYFPTSVQRLYRIGTTSNWLNYENKAIWVKQGETLYTKGIDIYGNETRIVSSYTANVPDALKKEAYDKSDSTYISVTNQYMLVDPSMQGKSMRIRWGTSSYDYVYLRFLDENKNIISTVSRYNSTAEDIYTIPTNTKWLRYEQSYSGCRLYDIEPSNEPTFIATNGYMTLTADPTKAIYEPYQMVTVSYFPTSVQRLYRIGLNDPWSNYEDKAIWVKQGETLYTKGIDTYGNETRIISSYTANVPDAIKKEAYDGNDTTYITVTNQYMLVDPSMQGKSMRIRWGTSSYDHVYLRFLDENKNIITSVSRYNSTSVDIYTIPENTKWIRYEQSYSGCRLYEIQTNSLPVFSANPTTPTNGNVTVNIVTLLPTYTIKYSFDSTNWNVYTGTLTITNNNTTIYAKAVDALGVESGVKTLTVTNIDRTSPTVAFGTNGAPSVKTASTKVTISDTGTAGISASSLQYVWDTQNSVLPTEGWTVFTNAATLTKANVNGVYYLWIKAEDNAGNSVTACSNAFGVDNIVPENPLLEATPTTLTNGNVTVTITYPPDAATKQYSTNGTSWSAYSTPLNITANVTVYARAIDAAGNQSGQSTITIANIDKTGPIPIFTPNGSSNIKEATTTVNVSDALAGLNESTLQYVWSTSTAVPTSGWATFTNGTTLSQNTVTGAYYLWIKAIDNLGNVSNTRSAVFNIDNTAPTVPTISTVYAPNTMTNCTVTVAYPADASKKEYSYDGENWQLYTAALSITNDATIYVRATDLAGNISGVGTRNIYILGGVGYIPTMTNDTTPLPYVVTSSSQYASAGHEKYRAFDKTLSTIGWASVASDVNDGAWIQIKLDKAITISKYYIISRNDGYTDQALKAWQLQGSNDETNWDILDSQVNQVGWSAGELRKYNVNTTNSYQYCRLYITASNGSPHVAIDEMNIYE